MIIYIHRGAFNDYGVANKCTYTHIHTCKETKGKCCCGNDIDRDSGHFIAKKHEWCVLEKVKNARRHQW